MVAPVFIRDVVDAVPDGQPVVEDAGIVDRVLAARNAEGPIDERSGLIGDVVDAGSADDQPIVERSTIDDGVLRISADGDLAIDVMTGHGRNAVDAVPGDRDPAVEVAGIDDADLTVARAYEVALIEPLPLLLNVWLDPATVLN